MPRQHRPPGARRCRMTGTQQTGPGLAPAARARFQRLQAYEDAIAYSTARLVTPCPGCGETRCDEHATDADLITAYRQAAATC
jgi:hypothetical protein